MSLGSLTYSNPFIFIIICRFLYMSLAEKFEKAAVKAVQLFTSGDASSLREAWDKAGWEILKLKSYVEKGCPRSAFFGLCEEGLVKGIPRGVYSRSVKNKRYALEAVKLLNYDPKLAQNKGFLWRKITENNRINHNHQLDVVLGLYNANLINI